MCGILAYLGIKPGPQYVLKGIKILRNRGYDSVGCCSIQDGGSITTKYANSPNQDSFTKFEETFESNHNNSNLLMAHCRWATCGQVTEKNSHPHSDSQSGKIHIVHNGIITNHEEIRIFLRDQNPSVIFESETDTETIINLISYYHMKSNDSQDLIPAIQHSLNQLEGTWGLVIINEEQPDTLYVCRKGSPILVGYSEEMCLVSSEISGFSNYLKNYLVIPDGEILKITLEKKIKIHHEHLKIKPQTLNETQIHPLSPDPFSHWTLKEIYDQPNSAKRALNFGGRLQSPTEVHLGGLQEHKGMLSQIDHLTILASGTSYHAGLVGQKYFQELGCFQTVQVLDAGEFSLEDLQTPTKITGILLISQSGETRDIIRCLEEIRQNSTTADLPIFSAVNVVGSLIAREADCGVYLNCGREVGVASTKSFLSQCLVMVLIGIWFTQNRRPIKKLVKRKSKNKKSKLKKPSKSNITKKKKTELILPSKNTSPTNKRHLRQKLIQELHQVHIQIEDTLEQMRDPIEVSALHILESIRNPPESSITLPATSIFILGHQKTLPIAKEGALKIKEVSYLHAEAYSSAGLKHGPLALIENQTPVIVIRPHHPQQASKVDTSAEEVKARGAYLIAISPNKCPKPNLYDQEILLPQPTSASLSPILSVIPLQYLAYLLSIKQGYNVDYPKNLAKCVTTD